MKTTRNLRDLAANLRHIANLLEAAEVGELAAPVTVSVSVSSTATGREKITVVDQIATVTRVTPTWDTSSSSAPYGWYQTVLDPDDAPWSLRSSVHGKRPDPNSALHAENERLRAKLAEIEQLAASGRVQGGDPR